MMKKKFLLILVFILTIISIILNIFFYTSSVNAKQDLHFDYENSKNYPLLGRRIFIENYSDIIINFTFLRKTLREFVKNIDPEGGRIGIYFEYLPSGSSIGINDASPFVTASLVKVPMVMALYKSVEKGELSLNDKVEILESDLDPRSGSIYKLGVGASLSLEEIAERTLIESDNTGYQMLLRKVGGNKISEIYDALDIARSVDGKSLLITPKHYTSVFKSLYLSSYLTKESSEKILQILTKTENEFLLVRNIPKNIKVAHKFGIVRSVETQEDDTLSDCGIIYDANKPYILCIMVKKFNIDEATTIISNISKTVFDFIESVEVHKSN